MQVNMMLEVLWLNIGTMYLEKSGEVILEADGWRAVGAEWKVRIIINNQYFLYMFVCLLVLIWIINLNAGCVIPRPEESRDRPKATKVNRRYRQENTISQISQISTSSSGN